MLKKFHSDGNHIIQWNSVLFNECLSYEEELVAILDIEFRKLRSRVTPSVKVQWKNRLIEDVSLETELDMGRRYPQLFVESNNLSLLHVILIFPF
ncbi:hypothetical protein MTR67_012709 [Solanum verrucosum]|uniref:Uncharacterized protein n=1 Tax=Solanum verrucosum TaxID=315347 RepID=A0AAF0QG63_SOLVR|nr:hypothetical protein MTR67_012709 [Solanum verrucosum]